jgi:hypothetical protein
MEYTLSGLPKLSKEVIRVLRRDLTKEADINSSFNIEFCQRQLREDPNLETYFAFFVELFPRKSAVPMLEGAADMYELLRRQSETYLLEESFNNKN